MATVADIITRAMKVMGVLASGEVPQAAEQSDALAALNAMMDSWANQSLALFVTARTSYTLTPSLNPHTIGTGGTFSATRPITVSAASLVLAGQSNSEFTLDLVSEGEWQALQGKATTGQPASLWVQTDYPLTKLWLNPIPANADSLVLYVPTQLGRFASVNTTFDMPPGYEDAITYNLAKRLCPMFGVTLAPEASEIAMESLASLKRTNAKPRYLTSDAAITRGGSFNLVSGDW